MLSLAFIASSFWITEENYSNLYSLTKLLSLECFSLLLKDLTFVVLFSIDDHEISSETKQDELCFCQPDLTFTARALVYQRLSKFPISINRM